MTTFPENFIITSDFATLKNDSTAVTASVVIPSAYVVASGASAEWHSDIVAGTKGAAMRARIRSSKYGSRWLAAPQTNYTRTGSLGTYTLVAYVYLVSAGTLRCSVSLSNPAGSSMTTEAGTETIDFSVSTFIPPFA